MEKLTELWQTKKTMIIVIAVAVIGFIWWKKSQK